MWQITCTVFTSVGAYACVSVNTVTDYRYKCIQHPRFVPACVHMYMHAHVYIHAHVHGMR